MTKRDRLNDSSTLQRRISAKTMKIDVNQDSARRGLPMDSNCTLASSRPLLAGIV